MPNRSDQFCCVCGVNTPVFGEAGRVLEQTPISREKVEWASYCRAILQNPAHQDFEKFKILGVGYRPEGSIWFTVPIDKHHTIGPPPTKKKAQPTFPFETMQLCCFCYLGATCDLTDTAHYYKIHSICWDWLTKLIGPRAEKNLDVLMDALWHRWMEYPYETDKLVKSPQDGMLFWEEFFGVYDEYVPSYKERSVPLIDPVNIPELQRLIERSKRRTKDAKTGRSPRFTRSQIRSHAYSISAPATPVGLPIDVKMHICDFLPKHMDMSNAVAAFSWRLPQSYWKARFPRDLVFELDSMPSDEIDWRFLYIELEKLTQRSSALQNRQRIFRILRGTRDMFFDLLGGKCIVERRLSRWFIDNYDPPPIYPY